MRKKLTIESVKVEILSDEMQDTSYLDQEEFSDRLEEYNKGYFAFEGVVAKAIVSYPVTKSIRRLETFSSGGLWGIESDSDKAYFEEVAKEELSDLKDHLSAFGVSLENWQAIALEALKSL